MDNLNERKDSEYLEILTGFSSGDKVFWSQVYKISWLPKSTSRKDKESCVSDLFTGASKNEVMSSAKEAIRLYNDTRLDKGLAALSFVIDDRS